MRESRERAGLPLVLSFVGVMTLTACLGLGLARVSGDSPRTFPVLAPTDEVTLGGAVLSVDDAARRYRPRIIELPQDRPDPVVGVSYEAWEDGPDLLLTYFITWADERHPNPVAHRLYGLYRWAFYHGREDVEYVQVRVTGSGTLSEVRFESAADVTPWSPRPVHVDAVANMEDGRMSRELADHDGDRGQRVSVPAPEAHQVTLYVATWNHLLDVVAPPGGPGPEDSPTPTFRTAAEYEAQAAARRGHPSEDSTETTARAVAGRVGGLLFLTSPLIGLLVPLLCRVRRRRV